MYFSPQNEENLDKVVYSVSPRGNTFPVGKPHVCSVAIYMTSGDLVHEWRRNQMTMPRKENDEGKPYNIINKNACLMHLTCQFFLSLSQIQRTFPFVKQLQGNHILSDSKRRLF